MAATLGVLLIVPRTLPRAGRAQPTVAIAGTATARVGALYPYAAPAPGPGCDKGAAVWTLLHSPPAHDVVCAPTFTRLVAAPLGATVSTSLRGAPLPARYAISLSVSSITPCAYATWHVATATQTGFDLILYGPADPTCGGLAYRLTTTLPSGAGVSGGQSSYPVQTTNHIIVIRVDGTDVQLSLDGVIVGSFTDSAPPAWSVVQFRVSGLPGNAPASADFSNFTIK